MSLKHILTGMFCNMKGRVSGCRTLVAAIFQRFYSNSIQTFRSTLTWALTGVVPAQSPVLTPRSTLGENVSPLHQQWLIKSRRRC